MMVSTHRSFAALAATGLFAFGVGRWLSRRRP
jgi:hypothetical protein